MGRSSYYGGWAPYVPVAERRRNAEKKLKSLQKKGQICQPVVIEGRTIARTFWGKNWCDNLESYSDYDNRLPRGRTYARNGSVIDLQLTAGKIQAMVSGSDIYQVSVSVRPLERKLWQDILKECAGKVSSLIELLQGRLSSAVMEIVTRRGKGLFPDTKQIEFRCSCPDSASMCKHVAAVLYGIGARLDTQPSLLFELRSVDPQELIMQAAALPVTENQAASGEDQGLGVTDLSSLFGIDLGEAPSAPVSTSQLKAEVKDRPTRSESAIKGKAKSQVKSVTLAPTTATGKKKTTPRPKRTKNITASELLARGISRSTIQSWLRSEVLLRTETRGLYQLTKKSDALMKSKNGD